jgi:redox-sensitive bicupin YhaK (pirin superfamily)
MTRNVAQKDYIILSPADHYEIGPEDFGGPGLHAIESIGPFSNIVASGPLITVHDSRVDAHLGIGHHPHRHNERLFYIMEGELDHDDSLNKIKGHMGTGDAGLFTEGRRGMIHSEWNHGDIDCHAYILVYSTDPIPPETDFTVLPDDQAPRYQESPGVSTKEVVGPSSGLKVHGDIRRFTDSSLEDGARLEVVMDGGEGALLSIQEGRIRLGEQVLERGSTVVMPPADGERGHWIYAVGPARVLRTVHGTGHGLIRRSQGA